MSGVVGDFELSDFAVYDGEDGSMLEGFAKIADLLQGLLATTKGS